MQIAYEDIEIREAVMDDATLLCRWWNDGAVMAHAGFPNGLGTTPETVADQIRAQDENGRRMIICHQSVPIGEMNYRRVDGASCEIGIKICESTHQNRGLGKKILSLFIQALFDQLGYQKIILDTNLNNKRAQHVYEQLGFQKIRVNTDSWRDQLGRWQSSVDYELTRATFVSFV